MARPNKGVAHVDDLKGSQRSKQRVKLVLATLSDQISVADACRQLGIGPTQFANLREQILQGAVDAAEPKPIGRPRLAPPSAPADLDELQQEVFDLEHENTMLQAKLEVNEALQAARSSKSPAEAKAAKKGPRGKRRGIP